MLFVDDGTTSIIDEWLSGTKTAAAPNEAEQASLSNQQRGGLGFVEQAKVVDRSDQVLKKKLESKKRKNQEVAFNQRPSELHGIVEDMEESRTAIVNKKTKKEPKDNKKESMVTKNSDVTKKEILGTSKGSDIVKKKDIQAPLDVLQKTDQENTKVGNQGQEVSISKKDEFKARKRVKTRSKQKNIRRDNRADSAKPAHLLDAKSKDYKGRPLTQETKAVLNLKSASDSSAACGADQKQKTKGKGRQSGTSHPQ